MAATMDNKQRFSSRVADYIKHRPDYPRESIELIQKELGGLEPGAVVLDVGSGTGILARRILESVPNVTVIGVEPNKEMREAGEQMLEDEIKTGRFQSHDAAAELTGLPDASVDLVVAGQAFHWFDIDGTRAEWLRVLKAPKRVALVWNDRRGVDAGAAKEQAAAAASSSASDFDPLKISVMNAYDLMLARNAFDYKHLSHHTTVSEEGLRRFFGGEFKVAGVPNPYRLTYEQLAGRLQSSSYTPQAGEAGHEEMLAELRALFEQHQVDGKVDFLYETRVFYGTLKE